MDQRRPDQTFYPSPTIAMLHCRLKPAVASQLVTARMMGPTTAVLEIFHIYIGGRLWLYAALNPGGIVTSRELSSRTGTHEGYVR